MDDQVQDAAIELTNKILSGETRHLTSSAVETVLKANGCWVITEEHYGKFYISDPDGHGIYFTHPSLVQPGTPLPEPVVLPVRKTQTVTNLEPIKKLLEQLKDKGLLLEQRASQPWTDRVQDGGGRPGGRGVAGDEGDRRPARSDDNWE